jgi:hypothetical protein
MWLQIIDPIVCCAQLVTGDAATDTFRLKLLQYRARCYLVIHAVKACKREIKSLITAGGPVSGEGGRKTLGSRPYGPNAPRPHLTGPLCSISICGSPVALLKFQMAPRLTLSMSSGS